MISEHKEYAISNVIKQCQSMGELSAAMLPQQKQKGEHSDQSKK
jgi:hypothetical protein